MSVWKRIKEVFVPHEVTPVKEMQELLEITTRCARRCAYDLDHALGMIPNEGHRAEFKAAMRDRSKHWLTIFDPAKGMKDYRLQLHMDLDDLERTIEKFKELCDKHQVNYQELVNPW